LWPIYPNPIRELAIIQFEISKTSTISVAIYNLLGQRVREIYSGEMNSGKKKLTWSIIDDSGKLLPTGIYFLEVKSENYKKSQKVIVLH
jgi:flagellar hook assembly protein FlgD